MRHRILQSVVILSRAILMVAVSFVALPAFAEKGSGMIYEDPFDLGSGGSSLTRAAQAGMLIANPALIPYGDGFHRWAGIEPTVVVGKDSTDFAQSMRSNGGASDPATMVDTLTKTPLHVGLRNAVSYINKSFGIGAYNHFEADLRARKFGELGLPDVNFRAESYQAVAASGATMLGTRALSLGVTAKYLYAAEPDIDVQVTDQESIKKLSSANGMKSIVTHNTGTGLDAGLLYFQQGYNLDFKMALKVDDVGDTKLQGDGTLKKLPQMYSAGVGTTLHNGIDALHLSADYRDIQGAYKEKMFKRVRAGAKIVFHRYIGLGAGIYDGWPAYAAELDLVILRLTAAKWTKEMGDSPGVDPRPVYAIGLAVGY